MANRNSVPEPTDVPTVGNVHDLAVESGIQRVARMQQEMHQLAGEQVEILVRDLRATAMRLGEIADGGDAYPIGVRELCSRMADELGTTAQSLHAIMDRTSKV